MLFSLVCITSNRPEVERFLTSLQRQGTSDFEVILIDQNNDDRNDAIVKTCSAFYNIQHYKVPHFQNTAKARNSGLAKATGQWIAFPDDDCWYSENLLEQISKKIEEIPNAKAFFTNWSDPLQEPKKLMFSFSGGEMTKEEVFEYSSAITVFIRRHVFDKAGAWNEKLGVGSQNIAMAGDDQELLMRLHAYGTSFIKIPELEVHHPIGHRQWNSYLEKRILGSGATDFYLKRKYFGSATAVKIVIKWIGGLFYNLLRFRKQNLKWYFLKLKGAILLSGKIGYEQPEHS